MFGRLEEIARRYDALTEALSAPDAYLSPDFAANSKEHAELGEIVEAYRAYRKTEQELQVTLSEADAETGELRELLLEEAGVLRERLKEAETQLKVMLLPKDKNDSRG